MHTAELITVPVPMLYGGAMLMDSVQLGIGWSTAIWPVGRVMSR